MTHNAGRTVWPVTLSSVRRAYCASSRQGVTSRYFLPASRAGKLGGAEWAIGVQRVSKTPLRVHLGSFYPRVQGHPTAEAGTEGIGGQPPWRRGVASTSGRIGVPSPAKALVRT